MSKIIRIDEGHAAGHASRANSRPSAVATLESGEVLYLPQRGFALEASEQVFLTDRYTSPKAKNIAYDAARDAISGVPDDLARDLAQMQALRQMLARFGRFAVDLVQSLAGQYAARLRQGRTTFRPVEIQGRKSDVKKDDTLLHVDTFPMHPPQGERILRVFTNISPHGKSRVWKVGEPFQRVAERFVPRLAGPRPLVAWALYALQLTKKYRTPYDQYMLALHDTMKADGEYQRTAQQTTFEFPPGSTWIAFTDEVSHAALAGQHLLEQTLFLPWQAMVDPARSPLKRLERLTGRALA